MIDYSDSANPTLRKPVNIPGRLQGISHDGEVLYTTGTRWTTNQSDWNEHLDASAYDGVSAHLIDSLVLPNTWPRPLLVSAGNIFLGRPAEAAGQIIGPVFPGGGATQPGVLETWKLSAAGKFERLGSLAIQSAATGLREVGGLLVASRSNPSVALFDPSNPAALRQVGQGSPLGCLYFDLTRADGALGRGVWLPLGAYGVAQVSATP